VVMVTIWVCLMFYDDDNNMMMCFYSLLLVVIAVCDGGLVVRMDEYIYFIYVYINIYYLQYSTVLYYFFTSKY
jgi:hypothetical protein